MIRLFLLAAVLVLALLTEGSSFAARSGGQPVALVTAERQNQLLAVALPGGRILRRITLPADPENVIGGPGRATLVVSARAGTVTLLDGRSLRQLRVFRGFVSPHIAAFSPDGAYAYVSDDGSGQLTVIRLARPRVVSRLFVGIGAHHLGVNPKGSAVWVALGERARSVAIVDSQLPSRPRLVARFAPGFSVHDLAFSPNGRQVWLTSDDSNDVHVVDAQTRRLLRTLSVGPPPQHVAFNYQVSGLADRVWLTSGYGSRLELVDTRTARVLRARSAPYGSFNLATSGGLVVTSSLLTGTLSEYTDRLQLLSEVKLADSTRDVALTVW